jgi:hypothetical protein
MSTVLNPVITQAGLSAAVTANGQGFSVQITHVAIGAGAYTPTGNETQLADRREKVAVFGAQTGPSQITVNALFAAYSGASYVAREIGFYIGDPDSGGVLFALYSAPGYVHATRSSGSADLAQRFTLALSSVPTGSVNVTLNPLAAQFLLYIDEHERKPDPHPQYVQKVRGIGEWSATAVYQVGARVVGDDGLTYRCLVDNTGKQPSTNRVEWEPWAGYAMSEAEAAFFFGE